MPTGAKAGKLHRAEDFQKRPTYQTSICHNAAAVIL